MKIAEELRNRVVGVTVITLLATIFLPMFLDEPKEALQETERLALPEKSSTDFPSMSAAVLPNNVDDVINAIDNNPQPFVSTTTTTPQKKPKASIASPSPKRSPPAKIIPPQKKRWFIQVASFNREKNAFALRDKLRTQGYPALVNSTASNGHIIYRLRVGPKSSKQSASTLKTKLDQAHHVNSLIVLSH